MATQQPGANHPQGLIGSQLGTYDVLALLGSGGMACVYRGFDRNLQRPVAIKVLLREAAAQPGLAEHFRQEARLIAGLHHAHIVQVYAFGEQDGTTYMVQELLPGPSLEQHLRSLAVRGMRLGRQDVVSIVAQLASALDAAHAAGIVHRDIKPGNALWNAAGALVLTDFGVARHILTEPDSTQTGTVIGTPNYLSPEQARGLPGTQSSDIYGLGIVAYELITGRVPFRSDTRAEVVNQHLTHMPPPLNTLRPDIPPDVELVVQRALAKDPEARFASAGELAYALKRSWPVVYERRSVSPPRPSRKARPLPADLHGQTTVMSPLEAGSSSASPASSAAPAGPARWSYVLPLLFGSLLLLVILGGAAVALQEDYPERVRPTARNDLVAPTALPTALLLVATSEPTTPPPTAVASAEAPEPTPVPVAEPSPALVATETPPPPTPTPDTLPSDQFAQIRLLLETDRSEGWARIDRSAWLARLDDVQRAIENGDTERAAEWLAEIRQALLRDARSGSLSPDAARAVMTSIDRIALEHGIALPPVSLAGLEDG
jgi:serine/threonine-protein kinase